LLEEKFLTYDIIKIEKKNENGFDIIKIEKFLMYDITKIDWKIENLFIIMLIEKI
jgi:hypothetical protein